MGFTLVTHVGTLVDDEETLGRLAAAYLMGTVTSNRVDLRRARALGHPLPPALFSPVRWIAEPSWGFEEFAPAVIVLWRRWGDCEDLAAWRIAELMEEGHGATPRITWRPRVLGGGARMHALIRHEPHCTCTICKHLPEKVRRDGFIEDPSRLLGM